MVDDDSRNSALPSLLVVDDDAPICKLLVRGLSRGSSFEVESVSSASAARERMAERSFDVVITDIAMPGEDGISLMHWGREHHPTASWIVLTGHATVNVAVRALQLGAFDFIMKPVQMATLRNAVENAFNQQRLRSERDRLQLELAQRNELLRLRVDELEEACARLDEQAERIQADLCRAAMIQRALLPEVPPDTPGMSLHALYCPSQIVGGDLYDAVRLDRRHLALLIADAAGHGLSAAMLAVLFRSRLPLKDPEVDLPWRPSQVLEAANQCLLRGSTGPGLFVTAAYCLVDLVERKLWLASAGHPPLILQRSSGEFARLFHTGPALGLYPDARFSNQEILLEDEDRLLLYTDGLSDRLAGKAGGSSDTVIQALESGSGVDSSSDEIAQLKHLARLDTPDAAAEAQTDDIAIVSLRVTAQGSEFDNGDAPTGPATAVPELDGECEILAGRCASRLMVSIRGRATWSHSAAFQHACAAALDSDRDVLVDLTLCTQLDSTLLGTIHELAMRAERAHLEFRLQGVTPPIRALLEELGMKPMLDHIVSVTLPLPTEMNTVSGTDPDAKARWLRILRAHEALAALNERNRKQFDPLVEMLRNEIAQSHPDETGEP